MKSTCSKNEAVKFLSGKFGEAITLMPMVEGQESQAFSFRHNNKDFVFRINPIIEGFQKDDHAYRNFSSAKIPIPKVVEHGAFDDNHVFCISEKAPGITLQDADESTVTALLPDITSLWRSISEIDISNTVGYGIFSGKDGNAPFHSWRAYLLSIFDQEKYDWEKVKNLTGVEAQLVDGLKSALLKLVEYCPEDRKLIHGDFGSNNVLIDVHTPKITAIIDWDCASYGDPLYDIAIAYFWRTWLMCMEKTCGYWEAFLSSAPNYFERIMCYQLHIGLKEIYENASDGNTQTLAWCQERCRQILDGGKNL